MIWLLVTMGCGATPEPLDLPEDPSAAGAPVGVRTVLAGEQTVEIFYPASDADAEAHRVAYDFTDFVPEAVSEHLGGVTLPTLEAQASRDLDLRVPEQPYPVLVFSHGFGGMRVQSLDLVTHLASRGYVVLSVDHPGRMLGDVLPCVFSPPVGECDLSGSFLEDPAPEDIEDALDWLEGAVADEEGFLWQGVDLDQMGILGHSAGGGSALTLGDEDPRFSAVLPMAASGPMSRDVPTLEMAGSCDYLFVNGAVDDGGTPEDPSDDTVTLDATAQDALSEAAAASPNARGLVIAGTGHLGFTDLCALELGALAEAQLAPRDDLNGFLYDQLVALATDGCPGTDMATLVAAAPGCEAGWVDLERAQSVIRGASTQHFDLELRQRGAGVDPERWTEASWAVATD
ncbi:MAG: hypothetical protein H6741_03500 [Alphaproteobacteria bacterium]|nr:hypothetical protein [Alphaproteobacteria bacterium]MCB9791770.1 hypothetical protein [Alphaproteobacteria bacterium]